jgi:hypothetical protein
MKDFVYSVAVLRVLAVCLTLSFLEIVTGCGFSYNSAAEKDLTSFSTPVISCSANPSNVTSGNNALIAAKAVSPIGLPLTYTFGTSAGSIVSQGSSATLQTQNASGNVAVTCQVVDTKGNGSSATTMVMVQPNESAPPTISCSANPSTTTLGGTIVITSVGSSPEGRPLTYSWSASSGAISGNGNTATLNTAGAAAGAITVSCKVADSQGLTASTTTGITVTAPPPAPPTITCSANPLTVTSGGSVALSAVASSPEGRPLTYSWSASSGAVSGSGNTATLNTSGAPAGTITVTCNVTDSQGLTASATTRITVTAPQSAPPTISCSANPSTVTSGGSVTILSIGSSPEGRPLTYTWSTSSGSISGSGNTATLNTNGAASGKITVTCNVADDQGRTASATTGVTVTSASAPPTISCSANPSMVNQGGTTTITASGKSAQSLPLTYSYSASAGSISGTNTTATLETSGVSAGTITVNCVVDQQGGGTASATTNVVVQSVTGEQAITNFQFTDSVGVNVHLAVDNTPYVTQFPQILQSMVQLGIKHYRDGLNQYAAPSQYENAEMLGKAGIKADWLMDFHNTASIINSAYALAPDATETFEGPNEDDVNVGSPLLVFMQLLNDTVRGNPATATMPIIAPSFVQPSSFATQGNLGSLVNHGNTHDYFGNFNPETTSYGPSYYNCGGYGSMQFNICLAQMVAVNDSVIATETGYQSGQGLSDAIIGRYELRTLFESLSLGIVRTYLYELIDNTNSYWGLVTANFSPKPAYTAIQNVLSLLQDVNYGQPGKFDYTLTGQTQNVNHLLLEKSDGTFYLAIWLGVQSANVNNPSSDYDVAPQSVTLTANTPVSGTTTYVLNDSGAISSTTAQLTNGSLPISVTDRVTLIALPSGQSH